LFACRCKAHIPRKVPEFTHFYESTLWRHVATST
jgi:hypothetical protein